MPPTTSHSLSLAMIARNESSCIARCLHSVQGLCEETIVVDTGSEDATCEIANRCGARVLHFPWSNDFSAARNVGLDAARGAWILVLDADEYLPPESAAAIQQLISGPPNCAYHLLNKSTQDEGKTGMIAKIVRLFPNHPHVRYEWPVHEQVVTSLQRVGFPIRDTKIEIIHTGYASKAINAEKQKRNLRILEKITTDAASPHPMVLFLKGGALLDLNRVEEALECYRRCAYASQENSDLHKGARVRMATCLSLLQRASEVISLAPSTPHSDWHPEMLLLIGEAMVQIGRIEEALSLLQNTFSSAALTTMPAYDPVRIKARCAQVLAGVFEKNQPLLSLSLLKLAVNSIHQGREITLSDVELLISPPRASSNCGDFGQ
jgi:tetratricopeptide (TPR) repeat protein